MRFNKKNVVISKNEAYLLMQTTDNIAEHILRMNKAVVDDNEYSFKKNFNKASHDADVLDVHFTYKMQDKLE